MEQVENWVRSIVFYLIFLTMVLNLLPSGKYEKYIRLFGGMVLVLVVIQPFTSSLRLDERIAYYFETFSFQEQMSGLETDLEEIDRQRTEKIVEEYELAVAEHVEQMARESGFEPVYAEAVIDENSSSETFGRVTGIVLTLGDAVEGEEIHDSGDENVVEAVELVDVGTGLPGEKEPFDDLSGKIAEYYELEECYVEIQLEHE